MKNLILLSSIALCLASCSIVKPGEVGIRRTFGKLHGGASSEGVMFINPFLTQVIKVKVSTVNKEVKLNLPSKEGLNVSSEISILYHLDPNSVEKIIKEVGQNYEQILILSTFRSSAADVCAKFYAKDMHSGKRAEIEEEIKKQMTGLLEDRGLIIEAILLKSISLPEGLYRSIEGKLQAEQQAQQMEFILDREKKEAERKKIEAEGIRTAQKIIKEGITEENIKWKSLEVFKELSNSPNTKIIITDGSTPVLINDSGTE